MWLVVSHHPQYWAEKGDVVTFTVTVKNQGNAEVKEIFNTGFTSQGVFSIDEPELNMDEFILEPGESREILFQIIAPDAGEYTASAYIDRRNEVSEQNEENNIVRHTWTVTE